MTHPDPEGPLVHRAWPVFSAILAACVAACASAPTIATDPGSGDGGTPGASSSAGVSATTSGAGSSSSGHAGSMGASGSSSGASMASGSSDAGGLGDGAGGSGVCPSNAIFCTGFETGIPSQAVFFPAYQQSMQSTYVVVDSTVAHSGSSSVKFLNVANPSDSSQLVVQTNTATFWSRVYIRQDIDTSTVMGHDSFFGATTGTGDANSGTTARVGEHSCQLEINWTQKDQEILSDTTGPDGGSGSYVCSGGIGFKANTWYCVETFFDGPNSTVHVYVDGADTTLVTTNWGPNPYDAFKFGYELNGTLRNVWYDDIVIAPQRVGCQ